jgi:REP element-mobilizing transposase RayT
MDKELSEISKHYPYAKNLIWTVMPNHIHAIIHIVNNEAPQSRSALSVIIGGLKRSIVLYSKRNNMEFEWQPRYHDHIIRGAFDLNKIARYIETNVTRWESDVFFDLG